MAKLYFYYASMNAGKSTTLLQADFNYRERGMRTMLFTAALDDRYEAGKITSRIGLDTGAILFERDTDIAALTIERHRGEPLACVLVDEAHRRAGVAGALLDAASEWLKSRGAPRVMLWTAERNHAAQRLFEQAGFRRTMIEMTREL